VTLPQTAFYGLPRLRSKRVAAKPDDVRRSAAARARNFFTSAAVRGIFTPTSTLGSAFMRLWRRRAGIGQQGAATLHSAQGLAETPAN